jgi:cation diffusion facilitator CzcD-associated flavoprotein CzcO
MYQHAWYVDVPAPFAGVGGEGEEHDVPHVPTKHVTIAIVGSGFSGLGAAIRLKQEGFRDFALFERANEVGGVWRDNSYPGAACDVQSHLYSFSFAPNPRWSHAFSRQPEILEYLRGCAREYGILPHVRFDHTVTNAAWDEQAQHWVIETSRGRYTADYFLPAPGGLSEPSTPDIPGLASFEGKVFHSARWDHTYDLRDRKVAVIGTGASAVQFIPEIQPKVRSLKVFQRTPAWVLPRMDRPFGELQKRLYSALPALQRFERTRLFLSRELLVVGFRNPRVMRIVELAARHYLRSTVRDRTLRKKLTPNFRIGCKRILVTSDYLPAVTQPNVDVETSSIREVRANSIVTSDGIEHEVDTIIFGTGFHVLDLPFAKQIRGRDGRTLDEVWQGSPSAYLGTTVAGFPNLFFLMGPGTGLGHTSVILMLESQLELVIGALKHMRDRGMALLEPRREVQQRYFDELQRDARGTVWTAGGCASWYLDVNGRLTSLWPHSTIAFRRRARFRPAEYVLSRREARTVAHAAE